VRQGEIREEVRKCRRRSQEKSKAVQYSRSGRRRKEYGEDSLGKVGKGKGWAKEK
jgi:hypothetical protein